MDDASSYIPALLIFVIVTLAVCGSLSKICGSAIALQWRPKWHFIPTAILLALFFQFLDYALFGYALVSPSRFLLKLLVSLLFMAYGYYEKRRAQMLSNYHFAFEPDGMFWKVKQ